MHSGQCFRPMHINESRLPDRHFLQAIGNLSPPLKSKYLCQMYAATNVWVVFLLVCAENGRYPFT